MATTNPTSLTKTYRLVYNGDKILVLGTFDANSITGTSQNCFETNDLAEMKAKIVELGLKPDPRINPEFC